MQKSELGPKIGEGLTAEIYQYNGSRVVKLFREGVSASAAMYEAKIGRIVYSAGLPAPEVGEIVECEGRAGILFEEILGDSMLDVLSSNPWSMGKMLKLFVDVQQTINSTAGSELPSAKERMARAIESEPRLSAEERKKLHMILKNVPDGNAICHGDYHPDNIIITANGPKVIDWVTAVRGDPVADIGRTALLLLSGTPVGLGPVRRAVIKAFRGIFHLMYMRECRKVAGVTRKDIAPWLPLWAAVRLGEGLSDQDKKWLVKLIKRSI